jgi:hypothetical protein
MSLLEQRDRILPTGIGLRTELSFRGLSFATRHKLLHERTDGSVPGILFGQDEFGQHGNFHPASYREICANPAWSRRLQKAHTAYKRMRPRANWQWKELDSAHSSDALLMNIFCHPEVVAKPHVSTMLGIAKANQPGNQPIFGYRPRTPLLNNKRDNTEVDMLIGDLMIEAKLTESNFQRAAPSLVSRYRDLEEVFDLADLPMRDNKHDGYQLMRGVLAAHATGHSFCVLSDARRPDLSENWYRILRSVRAYDLRCRLKLLHWQELASALPTNLQQFLEIKYGIFPS